MRYICKKCNRVIESEEANKKLKCKFCKNQLEIQEEIEENYSPYISINANKRFIAKGSSGGAIFSRDGRLYINSGD